jgi:dihydropteroate synthase
MRADQRARRDAFLKLIRSRPAVMGILNVTPDSFSDDGLFGHTERAVAHAKTMAAQGCDIVDIGGESTRPAATPISEDEELARVVPVLAELGSSLDITLSIDTYKARVAAKAVNLGAVLVNDVGGLQRDAAMAETVAAAEAALVVMHSRPTKDEAVDIFADIRAFFDRSLALAAKAGIPDARLILDPGIGFGKTARQNRACIARLGELTDYGLPILVGASRKAFLGSLAPDHPEASLVGTVAVGLAAVANGACVLRVHDVAEHVAALQIFRAMRSNARLSS